MDVIFVAKIPYGKFKGREITENGDVLKTNGEFMKTKFSKSGPYIPGKVSEYIHILVARAFIPNKQKLPYVLHRDGNVSNCHKNNLMWSRYRDIDHEDFKTIPGFSNYKVSKKGVVRSYLKNYSRTLSPSTNGDGYMFLTLISDDFSTRYMYVSRLVALTYLTNPDNLPTVDHIDRNRKNNNIENLRWANESTQTKNRVAKNTSKTLTCYSLEKEYLGEYKNAKEAITQLNLSINYKSLGQCARGNQHALKYTMGGFMWRYIDNKNPYSFQEGEISIPVVGIFGKRSLEYPSYSITNFGNLLKNGKKIKPVVSNGYLDYSLSKNNIKRHAKAHILVALFFVKGRTDEKCTVDHIDGNKMNPKYDNLEWVSHKENVARSSHKKHKAVSKIDIETGEVLGHFKSIKDAAKSLGDKKSNVISSCLSGTHKTAYGFKWEYV